MAQQQSLADQLVVFMRFRDEAKEKIGDLPKDGELWSLLSLTLEDQERVVSDALRVASLAVNRIGRVAEAQPAKKSKA